MTDEEIDGLLQALSAEGFALPYATRVADFLPSEYPAPSGWDEAQRAEGRAALRAADDHAWQQNRDALRRALGERAGDSP